MRIAAFIVGLLILAGNANAQGLVTTQPLAVTSVISSSSISSTSVFQVAIASSTNRKGCQLQNTSGNTMYVYIGSPAAATTSGSIQLLTKQTYNCTNGGIVLTDQINVTGTSGDTYTTVRQ